METFPFVFDERITLTISAQIDRAAQIFHRFKMFKPKEVYGLKSNHPQDLRKLFFTDFRAFFFYFFQKFRIGCIDD